MTNDWSRRTTPTFLLDGARTLLFYCGGFGPLLPPTKAARDTSGCFFGLASIRACAGVLRGTCRTLSLYQKSILPALPCGVWDGTVRGQMRNHENQEHQQYTKPLRCA